jgi:hypothetical protein
VGIGESFEPRNLNHLTMRGGPVRICNLYRTVRRRYGPVMYRAGMEYDDILAVQP